MAGVLDPFLYISYLGRRWKFVLLSAAVAVALATCVTLTLPREYTATARLVVEPPAGADPRSAMSVSPIYFESLKTYEQFAASDSLFRKALDRFHLRADLGARPIESLKKQVLKVGMIRNTRILEISATLPDARKAHELAQFVAESTVNLNRGVVAEGGEDLLRGFTAEAAEARARLDEADAAWARQLAVEPIQDLQAAIESAADMRAKIEEEAIHAEVIWRTPPSAKSRRPKRRPHWCAAKPPMPGRAWRRCGSNWRRSTVRPPRVRSCWRSVWRTATASRRSAKLRSRP